ncbi:MAG: ferredoxin [Phycisphaerae bacterium]
MADSGENKSVSRRKVLKTAGQVGLTAGLGGVLLGLTRNKLFGGDSKLQRDEYVWQIDPYKCTQCGNCATYCVLDPSAVKCVHSQEICGYCGICLGYHIPGVKVPDSAAENQLCPTNAIRRNIAEDIFYEYTILEDRCIGCAKCVKGCNAFGNGSLFMQVRHDRCVNCNECAIAVACPADAFVRVPASNPYLLKKTSKKLSEPEKEE